MEGELTTDGQVETFGETWEVKLKFVAPLGEIPPEFQPADPKKPTKGEADKPATKPSEKLPEPAKRRTQRQRPGLNERRHRPRIQCTG